MKTLAEVIACYAAMLLTCCPASAVEVLVIKSYAACKDAGIVERFEAFERDNDDQGYKRLYIETGISRECIFLRRNEILMSGETRDHWICIKESDRDPCYWTDQDAVRVRRGRN
ncbi:hypothetical protein V1277_002832 [Bradyrhizobium sp. AZCC 1588]|uniref:hypothetical protein n=1 Tax=unclassified Bradyrhizobium TaxID=2631580 RepID=UPI002FF337AE